MLINQVPVYLDTGDMLIDSEKSNSSIVIIIEPIIFNSMTLSSDNPVRGLLWKDINNPKDVQICNYKNIKLLDTDMYIGNVNNNNIGFSYQLQYRNILNVYHTWQIKDGDLSKI